MNDVVDQMLREHGRQWAAAQPPPPPLADALRTATGRRSLRVRAAMVASVLAVAAIAASAAVWSLAGDKTHHVGSSPGVSPPLASSAAPSTTAAPPLPADPVLRKLTKRARSAAIAEQDRHATGEAVRTIYRQAERVVLDGSTSTNPPGDTEVWVIQLHGQFTCTDCTGPASSAAPTGNAIALILNARNYQGYDFTITKKPHNLTELGTVIPLPVSAPTHDQTPTSSSAPSQPSTRPTSALTGVTWQGSEPVLTVVFTEHAVRTFDGCSNTLRTLTIGRGVLDIGKSIGKSGVCGGTPAGPPPAIASFDRVLYSHHLSWQRTGDTLQLTNAGGDTVELRAHGPALNVIGQHWTLNEFNDLRDSTHTGSYASAGLIIDAGAVHVSDICNRVSGSATVTDTTITFTDMRWTRHPCNDLNAASLAAVTHRVLSGTIEYAIRGDELLLYGRRGGLLGYTPSK